ncbi:MAG: hypothetical protein REI78_13520 [Pedobacter sp.]|nr:hypothetical protein [Pedobacter sp.]
MSDKKEHWIKNPWIVGVVLLVFTPPLSGIWDFIKGIPYWTTLTTIWNWFVNCELKLWWILVYFFCMGLISAIKAEIQKKRYIPRTYLRFTALKYGNFKWKWTWAQDNLTKDIDISNLTPVCPNSDCNNNSIYESRTASKKDGRFTSYVKYHTCSICNKEFVVDGHDSMIRNIIEDRIRANTFVETTNELPEFARKS